jgi:hypothetical protein
MEIENTLLFVLCFHSLPSYCTVLMHMLSVINDLESHSKAWNYLEQRPSQWEASFTKELELPLSVYISMRGVFIHHKIQSNSGIFVE